jgi:hypothetical protein
LFIEFGTDLAVLQRPGVPLLVALVACAPAASSVPAMVSRVAAECTDFEMPPRFVSASADFELVT